MVARGVWGKLTRQARFCDVGGDDALPAAIRGRLKDLGLQVGGHSRVDGQHGQRRRVVDLSETFYEDRGAASVRRRTFRKGRTRTRNDGASDLDILLTRHENEDVARGMRDVDLQRLLDGAVDVILTGRLAEQDVNWERSTGDGVAGSVVVELGELRTEEAESASANRRAAAASAPSRRSWWPK